MDLFGELGIYNGQEERENFSFTIENQSPMKPKQSNPQVFSYNLDDPKPIAVPSGMLNSYDGSTNQQSPI
jgi:hypothetical protein